MVDDTAPTKYISGIDSVRAKEKVGRVNSTAIQIFGTMKCRDTQKTLRFFKERRITVHFVDLREKSISKGELTGITRSVPLEFLIDVEGKEYERLNLKYIRHNIQEVLLEYPLLFKTPIVRNAGRATVGYQPDIWKDWLAK